MSNLRLSRLPLIILEYIYCGGFLLVTALKSRFGNKSGYPFIIISVGNLSVGGTGKSVVVPYLAKILGAHRCAIVLRGYKGSLERNAWATLVSDGKRTLVSRTQAGDEAIMYAQMLPTPVLVGRNRAAACDLISAQLPDVSYVILDDAYQNFAVKKDLEILLLDARAPFGNGHCLPAGRLRERDVTRAHIIILTHADCITTDERGALKKKLLMMSSTTNIFYGAHRSGGIFLRNKVALTQQEVVGKIFLLAAGVGSFSGVLHTAHQAGATIAEQASFSDHYEYQPSDIQSLIHRMKSKKLDGIVVTSKDWVKLEDVVKHAGISDDIFYVLRVEFEFLSTAEYDDFSNTLHQWVHPN